MGFRQPVFLAFSVHEICHVRPVTQIPGATVDLVNDDRSYQAKQSQRQ